MWTMVSAAIETNSVSENNQIRQKLSQFLAQRRFVPLLPGTVGVDLYTPADIDQVGAALSAIAAQHPGRFFYAALGAGVGQYPRIRPKLPPFDKTAFVEIVGASYRPVAPAVATGFPHDGNGAFFGLALDALVAAPLAAPLAAPKKAKKKQAGGEKGAGKKGASKKAPGGKDHA